MKTLFGLPTETLDATPPILTIGMFDGVHRGHQAVLSALKSSAEEYRTSATVLTFDRHPRAVVNPEHTPPMITTLEHRLALFDEARMDTAIVLPFDGELAAMDGQHFVEEIMLRRMGMQGVVLGHDTHFGRNRSGNIDLLKSMATDHPFFVTDIPAYQIDGITISSTLIREAVLAGDLPQAASMLGHAVTVMGTVVHGKGYGRRLGFPTLNLDLHHELHPPQGVYLTCTQIGDSHWPSATFIGARPANRPTATGAEIIESHLLADSIGDL
ncbi:MAG: bifunctional riboflavin kinase/FMN adenylyltransferase, partial [Planctomycetota bacterium]